MSLSSLVLASLRPDLQLGRAKTESFEAMANWALDEVLEKELDWDFGTGAWDPEDFPACSDDGLVTGDGKCKRIDMESRRWKTY